MQTVFLEVFFFFRTSNTSFNFSRGDFWSQPFGTATLSPTSHFRLRQPTSAYVSIRQHTSAYDSIRQHTSAHVSIRQHTSAYVSIRQHTSAYVSIPALRHRNTLAYIIYYVYTTYILARGPHTSIYTTIYASIYTTICVAVPKGWHKIYIY
jgi:hypothetical protein